MKNNVCLHAVYAKSDIYNSKETLKILKSILMCDALLSVRKQNKKEHDILYNGLDYISLCDYSQNSIHSEYSAYENYIKYSLSLMFPKEALSIIVPQIIIPNSDIHKYYQDMEQFGLSTTTRYSDMPDEVQVKDMIPLKLMNGITLPISRMQNIFYSKNATYNMVLNEIEKIENLLSQYGYHIPLYDINTFEELNDKPKIKKLVNHYYNKKEI